RATTYAGTVHISGSDAKGMLPANSALTNGTGTFNVTLKTPGTQTLTVTDAADASITGASNPVLVSAGAATHFAISAPASAGIRTPFNFTVTALDAFGNIAAGYAGTVRFSSSDAQAALPGSSALNNGAGIFAATLPTAGNQTISAVDAAAPAISGVSSPVNIFANVVIQTSPPALSVAVDNVTYTAPVSFGFPIGSVHVISAPNQQAGAPGAQFV